MSIKILAVAAAGVAIFALWLAMPGAPRSPGVEAVSGSDTRHEPLRAIARPEALPPATHEQRALQAIPHADAPSLEPALDEDGGDDKPLPQRTFSTVYDLKSTEELKEEYDLLAKQISEITEPAFFDGFASGAYEVLGHGNTLPSPPTSERYQLVAYQMAPLEASDKKEIRRLALPEDEYLEAYEMHYEAIRLYDALARR